MKYLPKNKRAWYLLAVLMADIVFFGFINPVNAQPLILITGFILLVMSFYLALNLLARALSGPSRVLSHREHNIVLIVTVSLAFIVAMQSIGQLSVRDVLEIVPLAVLLYIYLSYLVKKQ